MSTEPINDGGPAFPQTNDSWHGSDGYDPVPEGLSLRDWFAGQALAGWMSDPSVEAASLGARKIAADRCYAVADAMIEMRGQRR